MKTKSVLAVRCLALGVAFMLTHGLHAQYNNLSNTVIDGGGKTYSNTITGSNLKNVTFQNFVFSGGGGFEFVSGSFDGVKVLNNKASNIERFISVGSTWGGSAALSTNFEIACNEITNAKGYVFFLHNAQNLNVHHNKVVGTTQGGDGGHPGVYFVNQSNGQFHHNWIQGAYGNGFRVWGDATSGRAAVKIYNCVVVGNTKYSAVEANGNYNTNDFDLTINNCVFGDLAPADYISSGLTLYDLSPNTATLTNTKVFNVSNGMLYSDEGGKPSTTSGSAYYASMSAAGFSAASNIKLPDGTNWNDGGCGASTTPVVVTPVANAGADKTVTLPANTITLSGSASSSPDGSALTYAWSKVAGPATFTIASGTSASTAINGLVAGTYTFRLTVTNSSGKTSTDDVQVTVNAAAVVTVKANAGADQTITLPISLINLNGSTSSSSDGSALKYSWAKTSGPATFTLSNTAIASPTLSAVIAGTYVFTLTVTNAAGTTATDDVKIVVNTAPAIPISVIPVANAGTDKTVSLPTNSTTLDGTKSTSPDGSALVCSWTKISGPSSFSVSNPSAMSTTVSSLAAGTYQFRLAVTNSTGKTDDDTVAVVVAPSGSTVVPANGTYYSNLSNTVIDGGGKTYSSKIVGSNLKNVTFQNFVFTGGGGFEFTSGTMDGIKILNNKATNIARFIMVGGWTNAPVSNNFEIACNDINGASGYVFFLANSHNMNVHHNKVVNTEQGNDGPHPGVYFIEHSDGQFHHNWTENAYGNGYRVWGQAISGRAAVKIYNSVVVGSKKYSAVEANGNYVQLGFDLTITNCVFGDLAAGDYISSGLTMYDLTPNTASIVNTKVFNVSNGSLFSNEGGVPTSTAGSAYFASMSAAGFASRAAIKLPDGTNWNDGGCSVSSTPTTPTTPTTTAPVANAGADITVAWPSTSTTLNGTASTGTSLKYAWTKIAGPTRFTIGSPSTATTSVTRLVNGTYQFRLVVTDAAGKTSADTVKVVVKGYTYSWGSSTRMASSDEAEVLGSFEAKESLSAYPNPAVDNLNIRLINQKTGAMVVRVFDANGKLISTQQYQKSAQLFTGSIAVANLSAGIYVADITVDGVSVAKQKFIKQ